MTDMSAFLERVAQPKSPYRGDTPHGFTPTRLMSGWPGYSYCRCGRSSRNKVHRVT